MRRPWAPWLLLWASGCFAPLGAPDRPLGQEPLEGPLEARPALARGEDRPGLVLGALDDLTLQPSGGVYMGTPDEPVLTETLACASPADVLVERLQVALERAGVDCWRLGLDTGRVAPLEWLSEDQVAPPVLRGALSALSVERYPQAGGDAAWAEVDLTLVDGRQGRPLWRARLRATGRAAYQGQRDLLGDLAEDLAARLLSAPGFDAAWSRRTP